MFKAVAFNLLDYIPPSCPQQYLKACGYMNKGKYYTKTFVLNFYTITYFRVWPNYKKVYSLLKYQCRFMILLICMTFQYQEFILKKLGYLIYDFCGNSGSLLKN